ncbi:MAG: PQQ-binding-like beta-propeller repeat protein [Thaumarchaeota archaeon]|nr:PQQ-binding-like beta-propeller repeat protein [Nitrososphaerota archaeon]
MNRGAVLAVAVLAVLAVSAFALLTSSPGKVSTTSGGSSTTSSSTSTTSTTSHSTSRAGCGSTNNPLVDWTTYHGNNSRAGYAPGSIACAKPDWTSQKLDGAAYAEPLVYTGLVFVATENDSVYALNETNGAMVWRTHIGTPVDGSTLPCGNISPSGITGTPVIDPGTNTIFVVAYEAPATLHYLVALGITDGRVIFSQPADPPGAIVKVQQERGALSLANGMVYVPYGGLDGDCGQYHGWVVGIKADGSGAMFSYQVPTGREGGIWAPSGGAIDSTGNLFVATGNGASSSNFDYGNAVVKLSPTLQKLDYFAPSNWLQLNNGDTDLGSVGPLLVGHNEIFQIGKEGVGYILNASNLGGIGGQMYSGDVCSSVYGGTATAGGYVFVPCSDGLVALSLSPNTFQVLWRSPGFPSGPPIVTGNVVWALDTSSGILHGYDVKSGTSLFSLSTGQVTRFTTPATGDGRLFVGAGSKIFAFQIS